MTASEGPDYAAERQAMVDTIAAYVLLSADRIDRARLDDRVMAAMAKVRRHDFVPVELRPVAYANTPLPIGCGKTISQPFIVALMTDLLGIEPGDRVLEIGTGLGYQAAVIAELAAEVYSVELIEELAEEGRRRLAAAGYRNIQVRVGDGSLGWPQHAPFDKVIVAAAPELIPPALIQQLKPGGRMVIPAGLEEAQQLLRVDKDADGRTAAREVIPVRFARLITSH
jgi:protein-L-isoaspartate(D-aspartate) O-methyltransferase